MAGYSTFTIKAIREANPRLLGVRLAKLCIKNDIPVADVAEYIGVSKPSVYAWFRGEFEVSDRHVKLVQKLIDRLS